MQEKEILKVTKIDLAGIPCLHVKPDFDTDDIRTIIYYHGWESNKDNNCFLAKILAFNGYNVILPDALHHGERGALEDYNVEALKKYFWDVVINSVSEYNSLIEAAVEKLEINRQKLAAMGSSMGGFIASGVFASDKEIKCLINMNGACAWEKAELNFRGQDWERKGLAEEEQMEKIHKYDPLANKDELYPRPMLLLHGDSDTSVPIDIQRYFYDNIKETYKDTPERLKFVETPRLNHYKTVDMIEESIIWLDKWFV